MTGALFVIVAVITVYSTPIGEWADQPARKWTQVDHIPAGDRESCEQMARLLTDLYRDEDGVQGRARCVSVERLNRSTLDLQRSDGGTRAPRDPRSAYPLRK